MGVSKISKQAKSFIDGKNETKKKNEMQAIVLRVPINILKKIDEKIENREIKISRNTWLLETICKDL